MNLDALNKMSTEALSAIRERTAEILRERSASALRIGGIGWIFDKEGNKVFMRVVRVNRQNGRINTVSAKEVDPITHKERPVRWRVSPQNLTMLNTGPAPSTRSAPVDYAPKSSLGDSW